MPSSNMTTPTTATQLSTGAILSIMDLSLSVPVFFVLFILVCTMIIGRLRGVDHQRKRSSARKAAASNTIVKVAPSPVATSTTKAPPSSRRPISVPFATFFVSIFIFSAYQVFLSVAYPISGFAFKSGPYGTATFFFFLVHYVLYLFLAASFFSIWSQASIVFDIISSSSSSAAASHGSSSSDVQQAMARRRKQRQAVMKMLRRSLNVLSIVTIILGVITCVVFAILLLLVTAASITLHIGTVIFYSTVLPSFCLTIVLFMVLVTIPAALLVYALRRSNTMLKNQELDQQSVVQQSSSQSSQAKRASHRNALALRRRVREQNVAMRKLIIGLVVFCFNSILFMTGFILFGVSLAVPSSSFMSFYINDMIFFRVLPSASNILVMCLLFWPWRLPASLLCIGVMQENHNAESMSTMLKPISTRHIAVAAQTTMDNTASISSEDDEDDVLSSTEQEDEDGPSPIVQSPRLDPIQQQDEQRTEEEEEAGMAVLSLGPDNNTNMQMREDEKLEVL